jgi:hypothetical protein
MPLSERREIPVAPSRAGVVVSTGTVRRGAIGGVRPIRRQQRKATVLQVVAGALADQTIDLSVVPDDDGRKYFGRFRSGGSEEKAVTLRLRRLSKRPGALAGVRCG